jgi:rare lipoprotein A
VSGAYTSGPTASGARAGADAAPGHEFDAHAVPDAVPRVEPRSRYGNKSPYVVFGKTYTVLADATGYNERGVASWYGAKFHGAKTSSGEPYDMYAMSAAHKTLPLPCYARVTNLQTGASVIVRVNDRGPFKDNRVMDLSYAAATRLGITAKGTGLVEVRVVGPGDIAASAPPQGGAASAPAGATATAPPPKPAIAPLTDSDLALAAPEAALLPVQPTMWLQVGAFGERANAERVRAQLGAAGIGAATLVETVSNGKPLIKVRLGPFAAVAAMDAATARVKALGYTQYKAVIE